MAYHHDTSVDRRKIIQLLFWSTASMATPRQRAHTRAVLLVAGVRYLHMADHMSVIEVKAKLESRGLEEMAGGCAHLP